MKVRRGLFGAVALCCGLLGLVSVGEALIFPEVDKIGWYVGNEVSPPNAPWTAVIYHDRDDSYYQVLMWKNSSTCNKEPQTGVCQILRGYATLNTGFGFIYMYTYMYPQGNTIQGVGDPTSYVINGAGSVTVNGEQVMTLDNHYMGNGQPFFGQSPRDGVLFSLQWGCVNGSGYACPPMTKLTSAVDPPRLDWDLEAFAITDLDGDVYFVLPAIGSGRTGMEYTWGHRREPQGSVHPYSYNPWWLFDMGTDAFGNPLGYANFDGQLSDLRFWLRTPNGPFSISSINGQPVRATSLNVSVIPSYKSQGQGFTSESQYPPLDPAPGYLW